MLQYRSASSRHAGINQLCQSLEDEEDPGAVFGQVVNPLIQGEIEAMCLSQRAYRMAHPTPPVMTDADYAKFKEKVANTDPGGLWTIERQLQRFKNDNYKYLLLAFIAAKEVFPKDAIGYLSQIEDGTVLKETEDLPLFLDSLKDYAAFKYLLQKSRQTSGGGTTGLSPHLSTHTAN